MAKKAAQATPNRLLRAARKERGWTQQDLADRIGAPLALNVSRWENGITIPSAHYLAKLMEIFGKTAQELGLSQEGEDSRPFLSSHRGVLASPTERGSPHYSSIARMFRDATLPLPLTPCLGRDEDVLAVCTLLRQTEVRLVTLTGTGGVGKTRLGVQVATELRPDFADGVIFVSLASLQDPLLLMPTIAHTLGLPEIEHLTPFMVLQASLDEKQLLLVLDNFEHVIGGGSALIDLLAHCPHLKILITSRAILHLRGEYIYQVMPLACPDDGQDVSLDVLAHYPAIQLFIQRARAVKADFHLSPENATAIAHLCRRLDGLPLAIELAAARISIFAPHELLQRMDHRLSLLTDGPHDAPERQQTLHATLFWSYRLLSEWEQRLFGILAVFFGGFTLEAVESVCKASIPEISSLVVDGISSLIAKSLVHVIQQEGDSSRLYMLETIREYGWECLEQAGDLERARRAHARYYLNVAEQAAQHVNGPLEADWFMTLEREYSLRSNHPSWSAGFLRD